MNPWADRAAWAQARRFDSLARSHRRKAAFRPKVVTLAKCLGCGSMFEAADRFNRLCRGCR